MPLRPFIILFRISPTILLYLCVQAYFFRAGKRKFTQYFHICQSKHMKIELNYPTITRTLVAENQINEKTVVAKVHIRVSDNYVMISDVFKDTNIDIEDKIVRFYDFQKNVYNVVQHQTKIPLAWFSGNSCDLILVKLGTMIQSITSQNGSTSLDGEKLSETSSMKKERSKERVIFEVIQIVKKWRELHLSKNSIKKMSLLQAAKTLGMPKKSLDDYFYQLRLGEKYGFDFENHLFDRVGVLRTYLKNLKGHSAVDKYQKHPKNLKIIDKFNELSQLFYNGRNGHLRNGSQMQQEMEQGTYENREQRLQQELDYDQMNNFKSQFEYLLDEKDPFLGNFNFKKKMVQEFDQDQIFF